MCEQVNINVQETNETVNIVATEVQEVIDINVYETTEDVTLNITEQLIQVNVNKVTAAEQIQSDWAQTNVSALDFIKNKPIIPAAQVNSDWNATSGVAQILNKPTIPAAVTNTSDLINDGEDGVNPFITALDVPNYTSVVKHIVKNNGSSLITKGTAVYVTSSNGTNMLVGKASNTSESTSSKTMGLMQSDITTTGANQTGFVITEGLLEGLNTASATAGDPVWLGVNGALIYGLSNKPYAPAHLVFIGIVTKVSAGNGEIFVKVQNGFELKEIHDVDLITTTPINGHLLGFDGTLWVNKTIASWLGFTPVTDARTISTTAPLSGGGDLSANRTLSISQANTSTNGFLSSTDWNTFNNKQAALGYIAQNADLFTRLRNGWEASTDYISSLFNDGWSGRQVGTGAVTNSAGFILNSNKVGIAISSTGTTSTGYAGMEFSSPNTGAGFGIGNGELVFEHLIMIPTLSTSTERFHIFSGIIININFANPQNAIFFSYDEGGSITPASTFWKCYTSNAGTRTQTTTSISVTANQWYKLKCIINATGTSVAFYIDGNLVATHTTNINNSISYALNNSIIKTVGITARTLYTDYSAISQTLTTLR